MTTHLVRCAQCERDFFAAHATASTCSVSCRNKRYRARLVAQRRRLQAEAEAALRTGDVARLEAVARRTADLLAA